jgi:hypothetical protein
MPWAVSPGATRRYVMSAMRGASMPQIRASTLRLAAPLGGFAPLALLGNAAAFHAQLGALTLTHLRASLGARAGAASSSRLAQVYDFNRGLIIDTRSPGWTQPLRNLTEIGALEHDCLALPLLATSAPATTA